MKSHRSIRVRPAFPKATTDIVGNDVSRGWQLGNGDVENGVLKDIQQNT